MGNAQFWKEYINSYHVILSNLDRYQELLSMHQEALKGKTRVLDSAAGSGILSERLLRDGVEVHALDQNEHGLEMLKSRAQSNLKTYVGDAHDLEFEFSYFDGVSSMLALPFMQDPLQYLREHARVLRGDGIIVISGPSEPAKDYEYVLGRHKEELERKGLFDKLREHWEVVFERTKENRDNNVHNWFSTEELTEILERDIGIKVIDAQENPFYFGMGYVIIGEKKSKRYTLREAAEVGKVLGRLQEVVSAFEIRHRHTKPMDKVDAFNRERLANELKTILIAYENLCEKYPEIDATTPEELRDKMKVAEERFNQEYGFF